MADVDIGRALSGLGAAFKNEMPAFIQQTRQEDFDAQRLADREMALAERRKKTMFEDAYAASRLLEVGDYASIVDLMQDISLLNNKKINPTKNIPEIPSYKLKTISDDQIQELNQRNSKNESEIIFFKENYAKLIVENNELKIKLLNSKERIVIFEKNIIELEKGFENLSKILSKNSIIKLSDALLKNPLDDAKSKKDY